ncbi:alpha/beta-hydrolase [Violaceomyces palustris]|uniref:Alpha/beta-hydrolase n=1 Tax=Violaceomyces palustris TaxID=1673888 RepID=A0ACD0NMF0_9BASI|nr:alpha/beta-hydrolase [Violaceomyces palustris]
MKSFTTLLSLVSIAISAAKAAPTGPDPALTTSQATLDANIACPLEPNASYSNVKNPILLVPGTGSTGPVSWDHTWVPLSSQLGYQPCYISPPPYMLGDAQINAEYIVNAVRRLNQASGKKVPVMTWSQGGLTTQWALTFFPSLKGQVRQLVAFAPDYRGTIGAAALDLIGAASESVWQQTTLSHFTVALANAGGLKALVPTTNLYSTNDEVVQPESGGPLIESSYLDGASNVKVQDTCGPLFLLEHSQELFNQFTYVVASAALSSSTLKAEPSSYSAKDCSELPPAGLSPADTAYDITIIAQAALAITAGPKSKCEPPLKPYAKPYDPRPDFCTVVQAILNQ